MNLEFELNLQVGCCEGNAREEPAGFGRVRASQADVLVCADDGAAAKVEPTGLKIGVKVGLRVELVSLAITLVFAKALLTCDKLWVRKGIDLTSEATSCAKTQATRAASSKERSAIVMGREWLKGTCCGGTQIIRKSLRPRPRYAMEAQECVVVAAAGLLVDRSISLVGKRGGFNNADWRARREVHTSSVALVEPQ